jgi:cytochrome b561
MADIHAHPALAYTPVARVLHWLTAALVLLMLPGGILMANVLSDGPAKDLVFHLHRSTGALLLPIMLFRLFYRLTHERAPLPQGIPWVQRFAAEATHGLLYCLLIVQPLIGWVATSAYRAPILVFWLFELPPIWPEDRGLSERLFTVHRVLGIAIALLLCGHIGAALFHHFVRKDTVLLRMVRGWG